MFGRIKKLFMGIYEEQYAWLSRYFEELGFTRKRAFAYKDLHITDTFLHKEKGLSLTLTVEFSPRRRTWDVIGVWLMLTGNPSVDKRWSIWRSDLVEEKLKEEIVLAVDAFSKINASYADYDDNEPLYLVSDYTKPLLRSEEYYMSENERWIHAKSLGQLYIDAFSSGNISLYDIRPLKIEGGYWDGFDKDGHLTGGVLWKEEFCGFVSEHPPLDVLLTQGGSDDLWGAKQELKERIAENDSEIFPKEDVELCIDNEIEPYPHHLSCPFCGKPSEQLHWIHFCSPPQTWRDMCGREGALSICTNCGWQIEFICEIMN